MTRQVAASQYVYVEKMAVANVALPCVAMAAASATAVAVKAHRVPYWTVGPSARTHI